VQRLLSPDRTYPNMFDAHPPFQIDGNFGGAAGILEMLVQSDEESVHLLPALPRAWPDGRLHGVRCRGALTVDLDWRNWQLSSCTIVSERDRQLMVRSGQTSVTAELVAGQRWAYPASVPGEAAISG
jgi:alpha-L-fucosidase 2